MKRILVLVLIVSLLIPFASCASPEEPASSEETSSELSSVEDSSAEESEESKEEFSESEKVEEVRKYLSSEPDRTQKAKNLFSGAKYKYSTNPLDEYNDPDMDILTDGVIRELYDSKHSWVGFKNTGFVNIYFDLGEGEHKLADVYVVCLQKQGYGISLPGKVKLEVSYDGENYTTLGTQQSPADVAESCVYYYEFALPGVTDARYVRISINYTGELFIGEIMGFEYCEDGTHDLSKGELGKDDQIFDYYGYELETKITVPVSENDEDYKTEQNLAILKGTDIDAQSFDPIDPVYVEYNTPKEELYKLINGKKASKAHYDDEEMVSFLRATGRYLVVDLGNVMGVDRVCAEFLKHTSAGIRVPENIEISLSVDGEKWITVSDGKTGEYMSNGTDLYELDVTLEKKMKARYVRYGFINQYNYQSPAVEADCSELEVWGTKDVSDAVDAYSPDSLIGGKYPDPDEFGIKSVLWSCSGYLKDGYGFTYDNSLGYFAYLDEDGNIVDRLFDSVVIGGLFKLRTPDDAKTDAEKLIKEFTTEGSNIPAINEISGTLLEKFNDGKKISVWINLMIPNVGYKCSDIDGDGKDEDFSKRADCEKYLKWEIDYYLEMFKKGNYENINLAGFYWNNEAVYKDYYTMQTNMITNTNAYIHSLGYMSIWAPYYGAYGIWEWKDIGFDISILQPNYMFTATETTRLSTTAKMAHILGMGIELEIEDYGSTSSVDMYHEYLREGYDSGYMDSINALYQGSIPGALMGSRKSVGYTRTVYDDTYLFISGKLDDGYNKPDAVDMTSITDKEATVVHGKTVIIEQADCTGLNIRVLQSPVFGTYKLNYNGTLRFTAMKGYAGNEYLILELSDGAGNVKTVKYTITVTE